MTSINSSLTQNSFLDELSLFLIQSYKDIKALTYKHHKILGYF